MRRSEWLAMRKGGVGASESAAILGISPWLTAYEVWANKLDMIDGGKETPSKNMGQLIEPVIAQMYAQEKKVRLVKPDFIDIHPTYSHIRASLDYKHVSEKCILECKNSRTPIGWGEEGSDEVPNFYWVQAQHQMMVTSIPMCDIAALIGGSELRVYSINQDAEFQTGLIDAINYFWKNYIETKKPPPTDWEHPSTPKLMSRLYQGVENVTIDLGAEEARWAREIVFLKEQEKQARAEINLLNGKLRERIGDAKLAVLPNGWEVARNQVNRGAYHVAATSYIDMRIRQNKEKKK